MLDCPTSRTAMSIIEFRYNHSNPCHAFPNEEVPTEVIVGTSIGIYS